MVRSLGLVQVDQEDADDQDETNNGDSDTDGNPSAGGQLRLALAGGLEGVVGGSGAIRRSRHESSGRILSIDNGLIRGGSDQGLGLSLLSVRVDRVSLFGGLESTAVLANQHRPPFSILNGVLTEPGTSIFSRSVNANTEVGVTSRRRGLGQTAIPRIDDGLVEGGFLVLAEPSLLVVPPDGSGRTLLVLASLASSRARTRRRRRRRRRGAWRNASGFGFGVSFRARTSVVTLGVLTNGSGLGTGLSVFGTLVDVSTVVSIASVAFLASAFVSRSFVKASGVGVALLPAEAEGVLGVGTLVDVGTAESISDESVVTDAFEASLGVYALSVGRASLRSVVGIGSALVNVGTEETVASVTRITLTGDTRVGRLAGSILGTNTIFGYGLGAVVDSLADVTVSDVTFLTGAAESGLLVLAVGVR